MRIHKIQFKILIISLLLLTLSFPVLSYPYNFGGGEECTNSEYCNDIYKNFPAIGKGSARCVEGKCVTDIQIECDIIKTGISSGCDACGKGKSYFEVLGRPKGEAPTGQLKPRFGEPILFKTEGHGWWMSYSPSSYSRTGKMYEVKCFTKTCVDISNCGGCEDKDGDGFPTQASIDKKNCPPEKNVADCDDVNAHIGKCCSSYDEYNWIQSSEFFFACPECKDGVDNDNDGKIDYPEDIGCTHENGIEKNNQCSDGIDNDNDGSIDFPQDKGCMDGNDNDESSTQCNDGIDNDNDGKIDYPDDIGCDGKDDDGEKLSTVIACSDGLDNDGDGKIDFPQDTGCLDYYSFSENNIPPKDTRTAGKLVRMLGDVEIVRNGKLLIPKIGDSIYQGDWLITDVDSSVILDLGRGKVHLYELTQVQINEMFFEKDIDKLAISLRSGTVETVRPDQGLIRADFAVSTPEAVVSIRGSSMLTSYDGNSMQSYALDGKSYISNKGQEITVDQGYFITAKKKSVAKPTIFSSLPVKPYFPQTFDIGSPLTCQPLNDIDALHIVMVAKDQSDFEWIKNIAKTADKKISGIIDIDLAPCINGICSVSKVQKYRTFCPKVDKIITVQKENGFTFSPSYGTVFLFSKNDIVKALNS